MPTRCNILVIRLTALGDVLMTMPAVRAIREISADFRVSWLVEGPVAKFLEQQGFVDRVIPFPRTRLMRNLKKGRFGATAAEIRSFMTSLREDSYDAILDFHGIFKSGLFSALARGGRRIGFDRPLAREGSWLVSGSKVSCPDRRLHKVERNMLLARYLGASGDAPAVDPRVHGSDEAYVRAFLSGCPNGTRLVAVNPFSSSGSGFKRWAFGNYAEVVRLVETRLGATALIVWGPGEKEEAERLKALSGGHGTIACPTDVAQLFALMKHVRLYIGGDTGVMHLAALAGAPVLAVFGPTDHKVNGPFGVHHIVVRRDLPCSPCRDKGCPDRKCLTSIPVDDVFAAARDMWIRREGGN